MNYEMSTSRIDLTLRSDTNELEPRKKKICLRIETIEFTLSHF